MPDRSVLAEKPAASLPSLTSAEEVSRAVEQLLRQAVTARASDVHLQPMANGLAVLWRMDGVLQPRGDWPGRWSANVIARLKVLADLLTYRTDLPQEGRLKAGIDGVEMRLSTFPTLHGEKGVVRLFVGSGPLQQLDVLQLPDDVTEVLRRELTATSGCVLIVGPAGSGKTTTGYACLRELQRQHQAGKSLVTLEDPIEAELPGVAQTQVNRPAEFTYAVGLKSLLRQDPDAILVGEIRDRETAETVFQACLTGHLVVTTFHAGTTEQAVTRLTDLGIESYLLKAGLRAIVCQRLLRRLCDCAEWVETTDPPLWPNEMRQRQPVGCPECWQTGYRGRTVIAEVLVPDDTSSSPSVGLWERAKLAVTAGVTSPEEVVRVLGWPAQQNR